MKPQRDPRIDAYIADAGEFARPILRHVRALVHEACPAAAETLKWGHPSFVFGGKILCGFAAFKAHCTFGFWHQGMEKTLRREFGAKAEEAMGSLGRLASLKDLPADGAMRRYLRRAAELIESGEPTRPARKPRPALPVPPDLAAALTQNGTAAATFEKFSPSHRREYIEWLTEAKREETRQKRLATTIEWLSAGKARNWKYANC